MRCLRTVAETMDITGPGDSHDVSSRTKRKVDLSMTSCERGFMRFMGTSIGEVAGLALRQTSLRRTCQREVHGTTVISVCRTGHGHAVSK